MRRHITPTKTLALNSCCRRRRRSLKCNASTLCIHSRAGCLGGTQNGRTYVTKRRRSDEYGAHRWEWRAEGGMNRRIGVCKGREGNTKSKWQMSEKRRDTATVHTRTASGWVRQRVTKTHTERKARTAMHHQWKLTVRTLVQPRHCAQASYSPTLSLQPRARRPSAVQPLASAATHRDKDGGLWCER